MHTMLRSAAVLAVRWAGRKRPLLPDLFRWRGMRASQHCDPWHESGSDVRWTMV